MLMRLIQRNPSLLPLDMVVAIKIRRRKQFRIAQGCQLTAKKVTMSFKRRVRIRGLAPTRCEDFRCMGELNNFGS